MRDVVVACALLMPAVAWMSQRGSFGPDNGTISAQYPTLLVASGYAFAIWGLIFAMDGVLAIAQTSRRTHTSIATMRALVAVGFGATALWMPVFSQRVFSLALALIWIGFGALALVAIRLSHASLSRTERWLVWAPVSMHAGWLSLAVFLNTAQVVVAYELADTKLMLAWSAPLFLAAIGTIAVLNARMKGNLPFVAAVVWGLIGVYHKQSATALTGGRAMATMAAVAALVVIAQTLWYRFAKRGRVRSPGSAGLGDA